MSDLIDRQAAIEEIEFGITYAKAINKETGEVKELFQEGNNELRKAAERIKQLPSAQRIGRWIGRELGYCTCCGHEGCASDIWSGCKDGMFCPNCGAKMKGEQDE